MYSAGWLTGIVAACVAAAGVEAQTIDDSVEGFSRTRPILRPASESPTATIRQLRFSSDSRGVRLYSTGDDKLVRSWLIKPAQASYSIEPGPSVAWPIYRAVRGVIYALDVRNDPLGDRLAFGGVGAKTSWTSLLHVERPDRAQLLLDPAVSSRDNVVNTVAFHPGGTHLAVGHERTGLVVLWNLRPEQAATPSQQLNTGLSSVWHLAYSPKGDRLLLAGFQAKTQFWEIQEWDAVRLVPGSNRAVRGIVTGLTWRDDATWVAATTEGIVQRGQESPHKLGDVRGIAAHRSGAEFLIAVYDAANKRTQLAIWNGQGNPTDLEGGTFIGDKIALDVSSDGQFIAAGGTVLDGGGQPAYVIRLWDAPTRRPLTQFPNTNLRGTAGAPIANVGVVPGKPGAGGGVTPYQIGFTWGPPPGRNLPRYQFQLNRVTREVTEHTDGLGGEIQSRRFYDAKLNGKNVVYLADSTNPKGDFWGPLPVWADRRPDCYAVDTRLKLLALGYNDGIVLCDLTQLRDDKLKDKDKCIVRSFYGHEGPVTCLSFAPDGTLLLSGSNDGTICAWKIADVVDPRRRQRSELGVEFTLSGRALLVSQDPAAASPGAEAGFRKGQRVEKVAVAGEVVPPRKMAGIFERPHSRQGDDRGGSPGESPPPLQRRFAGRVVDLVSAAGPQLDSLDAGGALRRTG